MKAVHLAGHWAFPMVGMLAEQTGDPMAESWAAVWAFQKVGY